MLHSLTVVVVGKEGRGAKKGESEGSTSGMIVLEAYTRLDLHVATPKHLSDYAFHFRLESQGTRCIDQTRARH